MNKYFFIFALLISLVLPYESRAEDLTIGDVTEKDFPFYTLQYRENFALESRIKVKIGLTYDHREMNQSETGLKINLSTASQLLTQEATACFHAAAGLWTKAIQDPSFVRIKVEFVENQIDDVVTLVTYKDGNDICFPAAFKNLTDKENKYQGVIKVSRSVDWDYEYGEKADPTKRNLTFAFARAIGRILGISSTLKIDQNGNYYSTHGRLYSNYDYLIKRNDNETLVSIPIDLKEINDKYKKFIEAENASFYLTDGEKTVALANGPFSAENPPLSNLTDGLMAPEIGVGDYYLRIDDELLDVMEMLGWTTVEHGEVNIMCDEMGDEGLISAYRPHTFYLNRKIKDCENSYWKATIPCEDGIRTYRLTDVNQSCVMPKLSELALFDTPSVDANGLVAGTIEYVYSQNGVSHATAPMELKIDKKPKILGVNIEDIEFSEGGDFYRVLFDVQYVGANRLSVFTEGEYDPAIDQYYINTPDEAYGASAWIYTDGYGWLSFSATNNYGNTIVTYEFEPYADNWSVLRSNLRSKSPASVKALHWNKYSGYGTSRHYAFDLSGNIIWQGSDVNELKNIGYSGIVIMKSIADREIKTKKLILK